MNSRKFYNVLWFDDEHQTLELIKEDALNNDISLVGFSNAEDGITELERKLSLYDAVLVDGLFFENREDSGDAVRDKAMVKVARALDQLANKKSIPWFILSGQASFTRERNPHAEAYKDNKVYDKNNDEDFITLWSDIKRAADGQPDTQLRHKHRKVFEVCTNKYIGTDAAKDILAILKIDHSEERPADTDIYFTPLRKVMEDFFRACNSYGMLPDVFVEGSVALNETSKFFSHSAEKGFQIIDPEFPGKVVANHIRSILSICQPAAHRAEIDAFIKKVASPYLLLSVTHQLMNLLLWFKSFVDEHPDIEKNKRLWKQKPESQNDGFIKGELKYDGHNYYVENCFILKTKVEGFYNTGDKITITKYTENKNPKTKQYKYFAQSFTRE